MKEKENKDISKEIRIKEEKQNKVQMKKKEKERKDL